MHQVEGNIVDIHNREIYPGTIIISDRGTILSIERNSNKYDHYISPGFIDSHVHIESSMLIPQEFSKLAISKGTVAIVNDPHEIANVMGRDGVEFMLNDAKQADIKMFFTIPSCVPSTPFDCSGDSLSPADVEAMAKSGRFIGLSEMMNVPGVVYDDKEVLEKLEIARNHQLKIDGHAPGLSGSDLKKYVRAGISSDHECMTLEEAKEKIAAGMKILIREGSAAKNYEALKSLISEHPDQVMFCTDDSHPDDLLSSGEIDKIVRKAISDGFDLFDVLTIASYNPVLFFSGIELFFPGDICGQGFKRSQIPDFYKIGRITYFQGSDFNSAKKENRDPLASGIINKFNRKPISVSELKKPVDKNIPSIGIIPGEIVTRRIDFEMERPLSNFQSDRGRDLLKIVYLNRYENKPPQIGFITGFQLKEGAFATSVSHDSHNIIAVGCSDEDITDAINAVIAQKGGLAVKNSRNMKILPLPIAGIMTNLDGAAVSSQWKQLMDEVKSMGCELDSPFMTLSLCR